MTPPRLDKRLIEKIAKHRGKPTKYVQEQISKLAARKAISSESGLILLAREEGIGVATFLRKQSPHVQEQVRLASQKPTLSAPLIEVGRVRKTVREVKLRKDISEGTSNRIANLLAARLHPELGLAYRQILIDLRDSKRLSLRGTANEMREVMRDIITILSPDEKVIGQGWYAQEPKTNGPTRGQRLKYIFGIKKSNHEKDSAEGGLETVENSISQLTLAVYQRSNRATHTLRHRKELKRIMAYMNPVIEDLLDASILTEK